MPRVLIADDERSLRLLIRTTLETAGFEVTVAVDGQEAIDLIRKQVPDLLVLDWMMPGKTGIEVVAEIRQTAEFAHLPVILLTARGQARDMEAARIVGTDVYLTKPFRPRDLVQAVTQSLAGVAQ
ncbi:MAG: response regulator [Bryobacterales bacterium]|nr:response regulator [Bryobacterales bacterium]